MSTREQHVAATLVELADTLVSDYELVDFLDLLLHRSAAVVGAAGGGVMLSTGEDQLETLASSHEEMRLLELLELQRRQGPCVDSCRTGQQVVETDLAGSGIARWPAFAPAAVDAGYRSVLAIPMRLRGEVIGALNLFGRDAGPTEQSDIAMAQAFADMATIGILQERAVRFARDVAGQLQTALNSRVVLEQAKGVVAEREQFAMEDAFQVMRWYARDRNLRLRDVAAGVVGGTLDTSVFRRPAAGVDPA